MRLRNGFFFCHDNRNTKKTPQDLVFGSLIWKNLQLIICLENDSILHALNLFKFELWMRLQFWQVCDKQFQIDQFYMLTYLNGRGHWKFQNFSSGAIDPRQINKYKKRDKLSILEIIRDFRDPPEWPSPFNFYTLKSRDIKKL